MNRNRRRVAVDSIETLTLTESLPPASPINDSSDSDSAASSSPLTPRVTTLPTLTSLHPASSHWRSLPLAKFLLPTPAMTQATDHTPRTHTSRQLHPFYCPMCMSHYTLTLVSHCCGNYTCYSCAVSYAKSQHVIPRHAELLPAAMPGWLKCCHCTQCNGGDRVFKMVERGAVVRDYRDEVVVSKEGEVLDALMVTTTSERHCVVAFSPLPKTPAEDDATESDATESDATESDATDSDANSPDVRLAARIFVSNLALSVVV